MEHSVNLYRKAQGASRKENYIISTPNVTSLSPNLSEKQQDYNNSAFFVPRGFVHNSLILNIFPE
jgi:hypothetical protein